MCEFALCEEALALLVSEGVMGRGAQWAVKMCVFSVIKAYIAAQREGEMIALFIEDEESDVFSACWRRNSWMTNDDVSLLMWCCLQRDALDAAIRLMELSIERNIINGIYPQIQCF